MQWPLGGPWYFSPFANVQPASQKVGNENWKMFLLLLGMNSFEKMFAFYGRARGCAQMHNTTSFDLIILPKLPIHVKCTLRSLKENRIPYTNILPLKRGRTNKSMRSILSMEMNDFMVLFSSNYFYCFLGLRSNS